MKELLFYIPELTPALQFAAAQLTRWGFSVTTLPCPDATHVLLGVPATSMPRPETLPMGATVFGGNLGDAPYKTMDLLQDEDYLAHNAAITAHCAVMIAMDQLPIILADCSTLVIGWGRISKCLAPMLKGLGADVTVATRSAADRAILQATGFGAVDTANIDPNSYRLIFNTAPAPVLDGEWEAVDAVLIDLASKKGISGDRVIWARGLPGKHAPESSGKLIAATILRYLGKEHV